MSREGPVGGLLLALSAAVGVAAVPAVPADRATRGFYLPAQAEQGAQLYAERCAMCHGTALEGTHEVPGLTGKFVANWAGRPVGDLPAYLGRAMPQFAPGSLSVEEAGQLAAFLLRANGYPAIAGAAGGAAVGMAEPLPPPPRAAR